MEFFEAVARRYSHKAALDPTSGPSDAELRRIVEAGVAAPSGMNKQSAEFVIITHTAVLQRIAAITDHPVLKTAPAIIAVVSNLAEAGDEFYLQDYGAATENLMLAATALGYSCGWIDGALRRPEVSEPLAALLALPEGRVLSVLVPVGRPAEESPRREKKPFERRVCWNRYTL